MENTDLLLRKAVNQKRRIVLSHLTGVLGSGIFTFGIGLMILRETGSASNFGFSQIVGPLVSFLLLPITGSIVDKFDRKKIVIIAQLCSITAIALFLTADHFAILPKLVLIYILLTILAITDLFLNTTYGASVIEMVPEDQVQPLLSAKSIVQTIAMMGSPILGAILYKLLSFEWFVAVEIFSEIITLLIVLGLDFYLFKQEKAEQKQESAESSGMLALFKEGLVFIRENEAIRFMVMFAMVTNLVFSGFNVGFSFVQIKVFDFGDIEYGVSQFAFAIGMLGASLLLAGKKEFKDPLYMTWVLIFPCQAIIFLLGFVIFLQLPHYANVATMVLGALGLATLIGFINIPMKVWQVKAIPANMQGRVNNLINTGASVLMPFGILFFGVLYDYPIRPDAVLMGSAIVGAVINFLIPRLAGFDLVEQSKVRDKEAVLNAEND
ncbi:MAG: MFS transporter [Peptostreptococcaceae bacterium]|nr:MFS transporter [Peptostreptococcaceae bacterium]